MDRLAPLLEYTPSLHLCSMLEQVAAEKDDHQVPRIEREGAKDFVLEMTLRCRRQVASWSSRPPALTFARASASLRPLSSAPLPPPSSPPPSSPALRPPAPPSSPPALPPPAPPSALQPHPWPWQACSNIYKFTGQERAFTEAQAAPMYEKSHKREGDGAICQYSFEFSPRLPACTKLRALLTDLRGAPM